MWQEESAGKHASASLPLRARNQTQVKGAGKQATGTGRGKPSDATHVKWSPTFVKGLFIASSSSLIWISDKDTYMC